MKRIALMIGLMSALTIGMMMIAAAPPAHAQTTGSWGSNYGKCFWSHAPTNANNAEGFATWYVGSGHSYVYAVFNHKTHSSIQIQVRGKCYNWNSFGYGSWGTKNSAHRACTSGSGGGRKPYASSCRIRRLLAT